MEWNKEKTDGKVIVLKGNIRYSRQFLDYQYLNDTSALFLSYKNHTFYMRIKFFLIISTDQKCSSPPDKM